MKYFVKDTNIVLLKLSKRLPLTDYLFLCTINVVGLYPSNPHNDGRAAIKNALDKRTDKTVFSKSFINW